MPHSLAPCSQVWRQRASAQRRSTSGGGASSWQEALVLVAPVSEEEAVRARQRRRPPPINSINMVAWSLDDRKVGLLLPAIVTARFKVLVVPTAS